MQLSGKSNFSPTAFFQEDSIRKTIPYTLPWDDMPIDLSFIFEKEKPAGKHGFLKAEGEKFIFQDGTEAKFWGTTFNYTANFPSHEYSEKVAKRLAKTGINIVRLCVVDNERATPNIFQFTSGENINTMNFDPESIERLDYLFWCLKKEGIYVFFDGLVFRIFKTNDGVESAGKLGIGAKPYSNYNRRLIELQKKFNHDLWTHINPYTKLAYKDDPAIVLFDITNENDLWSQKVTVEPYRNELEELYRKWATGRGIIVSKDTVEFDPKQNINIANFFINITENYYKEMILDMRRIGVKIPIVGTNGWTENAAYLSAQMVGDFIDAHSYWSLPEVHTVIFCNDPMTGSLNNIIPHLAFYRVHDKPFFVSEWDHLWPNEWRAESPLLMASVASFQGWGGIIQHAYRNTSDKFDVDMIGSSAFPSNYGGILNSFNDPAKFGLYYHAALIMRRGDVKHADKTVSVKLNSLLTGGGKAYQLTPEKHRVETVLPGYSANGEIVITPDKSLVGANKEEVLSDTGELYRNLKRKTGWIDTPFTKAVYGFIGKDGKRSLSDLTVNVKTEFAALAISSLTSEPIKHSANMLLTAVGRADNTDSKYNANRTQQMDPGHGPILIEVIEATIEIKTDKKKLRVMSVNPQGFINGYIPSKYKDEVFSFEIGKEYQSMYYLIQEL
jgi:hypothetical protein